jgi:hypothetical protein
MEFSLIERTTFEAMSRDAGFEVVDLYGSYQRQRFDRAVSPVMIWVLQRTVHPARAGLD